MLSFVISCIVFSIKFWTCTSSDVIQPIISVEVNPQVGFHRELNYVVHFDYPLAGKDNFEYYLEQKFPSSMYVDVNQLDDLVRLQKIKVIYPHHIDVEVPTEKALPFSIIIWDTPKITNSIVLPIHYRYHSPGTKNFVRVEIQPPKLYLKRPDEDISTFLVAKSNSTKYCSSGTEFYPKTSKLDLACDYEHLEYDLFVKNSLITSIPVGDINLYELVFYVTIIVSWIGCLCVLSAAQNKMEIIKIKLK